MSDDRPTRPRLPDALAPCNPEAERLRAALRKAAGCLRDYQSTAALAIDVLQEIEDCLDGAEAGR